MRIAKFELTEGRFTAIPDESNWGLCVPMTINGTDFKVGEYSGDDNTIQPFTGTWPPAAPGRTLVKDWEFAGMFTPSEFRKIEQLRATDSTGGNLINQLWAIANMRGTIDLTTDNAEAALSAIVSGVPGFNDKRKEEVLAGIPG